MFVTGCHRSGTSLLASLVSGMINRPAKTDVLPPALDNPHGFNESLSLNRIHNQLLQLADCRWDCPPLFMPEWSSQPFFSLLFDSRQSFADLSLNFDWVDKNPRLCITANAMEHLLLRRIPIIAVLRDPQSVAISLFRRNGLPFVNSLMIWYLYNYHLSSVLRDGDFLLTYETLINLDLQGLDKIRAYLGDNGLNIVSNIETSLLERIDQSLLRAVDYQNYSFDTVPHSFLRLCSDRYVECSCPEIGIKVFKDVFSELPMPLMNILSGYGCWHWTSSS